MFEGYRTEPDSIRWDETSFIVRSVVDWWSSSVVLPVVPILIAIIAGYFYIKEWRESFMSALGDGPLFFVAIGIVAPCLISRGPTDPLMTIWLLLIFLVSTSLFTMATIWKHNDPPIGREIARRWVVWGSIGVLLGAITAVPRPSLWEEPAEDRHQARCSDDSEATEAASCS